MYKAEFKEYTFVYILEYGKSRPSAFTGLYNIPPNLSFCLDY